MNLQDSFLNQVRIQKIPVSIYLTSGYQLKGVVTGFDSFIVLLDAGDRQNLVYKHAISTINPMKPVTLFKQEKVGEEGSAEE